MNFQRRSENYTVIFNRRQAIEELKRDIRVEEIIDNGKSLKIVTKPILLKKERRCRDDFYQCPIGRYTISITSTPIRHQLNCQIIRCENYVYFSGNTYYHLHLNADAGTICWGDSDYETYKMKLNRDWYWLGKTCLDLLEDGGFETEDTDMTYGIYGRLQIDYAFKHRLPGRYKIKERLDKIIKRYDTTYERDDE